MSKLDNLVQSFALTLLKATADIVKYRNDASHTGDMCDVYNAEIFHDVDLMFQQATGRCISNEDAETTVDLLYAGFLFTHGQLKKESALWKLYNPKDIYANTRNMKAEQDEAYRASLVDKHLELATYYAPSLKPLLYASRQWDMNKYTMQFIHSQLRFALDNDVDIKNDDLAKHHIKMVMSILNPLNK